MIEIHVESLKLQINIFKYKLKLEKAFFILRVVLRVVLRE